MSNMHNGQQGGIEFNNPSPPPGDGGFQPTFSAAPIGPSQYPATPSKSSGFGWKKGCLIAGLAVIVLGAGVVFLVLKLTGPAVESANGFLALLGKGDMTSAYKQTARIYQQNVDEETFEVVVQKLGLNDFSSASWSSRSVENNVAKLDGSFTTTEGDEVPLTMTLIKSGDDWKVTSFTSSAVPVKAADTGENEEEEEAQPEEEEAAVAPKVPPEAEMADMARESILALDQSVRTKNFQTFYDHTAKLWQKQTRPEDLKDAFQSFIDSKIDMSGVADVEPEFDEPPSIDSDDLLNMNGVFSTADNNITFKLKYAIEKGEWKLVSINVNVEGK